MVMKVGFAKRSGRSALRFTFGVMTLPFFAYACAETSSPRLSAAAIAQNPCRDAHAWRDDLRILEPKSVVGIEPHYTRNTCDGTTQVIGTQIVMRRPENSSSAALSRMLRCGASRVLVGKDDPSIPSTSSLWLPDGWLDVVVKPDGANFLVTLSSESIPKNIQLFHRTTDFLGVRGPEGVH
jgi:hypothetical protein